MKKHSIKGVAVFVALIICLLQQDQVNAKSAQSFSSSPVLVYYYYAYIGSDYSEQGYLTASNWVARGSSPGAPCVQGADEVPCVIYAWLPFGKNKITDLLAFLNNLGCGFVVDYVENPSHVVYYKPAS